MTQDGDHNDRRSAKERAAKYYAENRDYVIERVLARQRARRDAGLPRVENPEKLERERLRSRERSKTYRQSHLEAERGKDRSRSRNSERRENRRQWGRDNPGQIQASNASRRALLSKSTEHYSQVDVDRLREQQQGKCYYCARPMLPTGANSALSERVDHLIAVSRGGSDSARNICLACRECNSSKGTRTAAQFLASLDRPGLRDNTAGIITWLVATGEALPHTDPRPSHM